MGGWHPGIAYSGRVLELVDAGQVARVLIEDRIADLVLPLPPSPQLQAGDLIDFTVRVSVPGSGAVLAESVVRRGGPIPTRDWSRGDALRWRRPGKTPSRLALLRLRHCVLQSIRATFDAQGFLEVETPCLVKAPSPEPQFAPVAAGNEFLITSPEFQLKRLLVGGAERIVRIGPSFRGAERGKLHNPEFTLVEWYRAHADVQALASDLHVLLASLVPVAEEFQRGHPAPAAAFPPPRLLGAWVRAPLPQVTVADLFQRHLRMDLRGVTTVAALKTAARAAGWPYPAELPDDFDGAFSRLWIDVEARFPPEPFLVIDWPAPLASLARLKPDDPAVAERMELYAGGIELANGFGELTDAAQQRTRFHSNLAQRSVLGMPALPLDEAFLSALEDGMPPSAGMALGVDRLVMLVAGVADIRDVLAFTADER